MLRLLFYKTLTVKPYKRYRKLFLKESASTRATTLSCYCLLKGYEFSEVEQTGYAKHRLLNLKVSSRV